MKENETLLKIMFEHSPINIALIQGPDHKFIYANISYRNVFLDGEDPTGKTLIDFFPEAEAQGFTDILKNVFFNGIRYIAPEARFERHTQASEPKLFFLNLTYEPLVNDNGQIDHILMTMADVTEAVVSRKQIAESLFRLENSLSNGKMGTWRIDLETKLLTADNAFRDFHNAYGAEDFQSAISRIGHSEDQDIVRAGLESTIKNGIPYDVEYRIIKRDGLVNWMAARGSPIYDDAGQMVAISGVAFDIQEKKSTELALISSQAKDKFLIRLDSILRTKSDAKEVQGEATRLLSEKFPNSIVIYSEIDENTAQASVQPLYETVQKSAIYGSHKISDFPDFIDNLRTGSVIICDIFKTTLIKGDELQRVIALGIGAILSIPILEDKVLIGSLNVIYPYAYTWTSEDTWIVQAVADRTRDAVQRARVETSLRETDLRKDEFLAMLAHELRNPLAPIGAAAQLLQLVKLDEDRVRKTSAVIGRQVSHMTGLIDDLLDVSRVTRGLIQLDNAALDIQYVVNDAFEQVSPIIRSRNHELTMRLTAQLGLVWGDKKRLVQVLANILNNAAKYTGEGGHIVLCTSVQDHEVLIEVSDDGIGMTPETEKHAFDLFAQAERSSDRSSGGLGLGLALVKSLVELHGGTVTCRSDGLGQGSTFSIWLPRLAEQNHPASREANENVALAKPSSSLKILVVDDNVDAAAMLKLLLEAMGHEVQVENGAFRALEKAKRYQPQVCLVDIGLPDIDGNEVARRLRAQPENVDTVLVAVTGYGQESDRASTSAAGFDHHLVKPVDTGALTSILSAIKMN